MEVEYRALFDAETANVPSPSSAWYKTARLPCHGSSDPQTLTPSSHQTLIGDRHRIGTFTPTMPILTLRWQNRAITMRKDGRAVPYSWSITAGGPLFIALWPQNRREQDQNIVTIDRHVRASPCRSRVPPTKKPFSYPCSFRLRPSTTISAPAASP